MNPDKEIIAKYTQELLIFEYFENSNDISIILFISYPLGMIK